MAQLSYVTTLSHATPGAVTAVTDMDVFVDAFGQATLYATSRSGQAITAYSVEAGAQAGLIDTQYLTEDTTALELMIFDGGLKAVTLGPHMDGPLVFQVAADGRIENTPVTLTHMTSAEGFSDIVLTDTTGGTYIYATDRVEGRIKAYQLDAEGAVLPLAQTASPEASAGLIVARSGSDSHLIAVGPDGDQITSYQVGPDGDLQASGSVGVIEGLGLAGVSALAQATLPDSTYIVVAAQGSSSLSVLHMNSDGALTPVDHVLDDLNTRFQSVTSVEVVTLGDQVFVLAGGRDDGVSLFQLLPGGRLLHHATMADTFAASLANVSSVAASAQGGHLEIFAASHTEQGITQLTFDPGPLAATQLGDAGNDTLTGTAHGEVIFGGDGDDHLNGQAGNDILMDGNGADHLTGGAGQDIFVMAADGITDTIADFNPDQDVLDLSAYRMLRNIGQLVFETRPDGAILTFRDETLRIISADQRPLDAGDLLHPGLINLSRVPVSVPGDQITFIGKTTADFITGNKAANYISAGTGDDRVFGMDGSDRLIGGFGLDFLDGGLGDDVLLGDGVDGMFDPVAGQVFRVYQATLDRLPDGAGHLGWTKALLSGVSTLLQVGEAFVASSEFQDRYGATSDTDFVTLLYHNVLGRAPDAGGLQGWLDRLGGGQSRAEVVLGFSESAEFIDTSEAGALAFSRAGHLSGWSDDLFRLYQATLDRAPDVAGLQGWAGELADGVAYLDVVSGFVASPEFQDRYGATSDTDFVTLLYHNVLGRAPDAGGLQGWLDRLDGGGQSRAEVVRGFAQSTEFRANTAEALASWMRANVAGDTLVGGQGENVLFGGFGADQFVFDAGMPGRHEIVDMDPWDQVLLEGFSYTTPAEALAALTRTGPDTSLSEAGTEIIFRNIQPEMFNEHMFEIV
ncbi:DUF4214 domain-containing protein [Rhodophyticola sp. CCM32]|uniref:DUF4214 domain-containing protein n=1 Tax=Rhodophyticola sp. CCM32 TaxID=2916397 RepID=UPI00107F555A|nr:DUF4214 domain-containing protein [Rhodophyticola sp. CCM32]QBY02236.1 DUF4214 domain-containing protein [Rhodophyticola sp. CCM32]